MRCAGFRVLICLRAADHGVVAIYATLASSGVVARNGIDPDLIETQETSTEVCPGLDFGAGRLRPFTYSRCESNAAAEVEHHAEERLTQGVKWLWYFTRFAFIT